MKAITYLLLLSIIALSFCFSDDMQKYDIIKSGDECPIMQVTTINNQTIDFSNKIVWVNLFATWCPPCLREFPEMEKVWEKHKANPNFAMVAIGREEIREGLILFAKDKRISLPLVADKDRKIYNLFAKGYIPRTYLIDSHGKVLTHIVGYDHEEFNKMAQLLDQQLEALNQTPEPKPEQKTEPKPEQKTDSKIEQTPEAK